MDGGELEDQILGEMRPHDGAPTVLTVCYGGAHAATLAPVARELLRRERVKVVSLALTTAAERFARLGIPSCGYRDYVELPGDAEALRYGEELAATVNGQASGVAYEETVAYMGLSMAALAAEYGDDEARARFARLGRHAFLQRAVLRRIIDRERPRVVVATNSPKSERAAILVGNELDLTTLMVPDLLADPSWETYAPFEARWFAVMNEAAWLNVVEKHCANPAQVVVTGQPAFDKSAVPPLEECRRYVAREIGLDPTRRYILLATTNQVDPRHPTGASSSHALEVVRTMLRLVKGIDVVVKPHPSEPAATYSEFSRQPRWWIAAAGTDINQLIRPAAAVLGAGSTTAVVDALSLSVPTAIVQLDGKDSLLTQARSVAVLRCDAEIAEWLEYPQTRGWGASDLTPNAGAAARVADLIEQLSGVDVPQ